MEDRLKLLVVEDDPGLSAQYRVAFPAFRVLTASNRVEALRLVAKEQPAVALLDLGLPPDPDGVTEGFAALSDLLELSPDMKVVVATGNTEHASALRAVRMGAYDFCQKPTEPDMLRGIMQRAATLYTLEAENRRLAQTPQSPALKHIITAHESMLKLCSTIERLATTDVPVLLYGESGTGKEALARALHDLGPRVAHPFVAINCGAIPEALLESELFGHERGAFTGAVKQTIGKIESAHGGTLLLDEIGDLPYPLQVKLLRFLQERTVERIGGRQQIKVDVRVVSATNQNLEQMVAENRFRADLFYRLNSVLLKVPPLRDRGDDAALLARVFLTRFNLEYRRRIRGFTEAALAGIANYAWPGNVRELENKIKRAVVMVENPLIDVADLELSGTTRQLRDLNLRITHRS